VQGTNKRGSAGLAPLKLTIDEHIILRFKNNGASISGASATIPFQAEIL